MTEIFEPVDAFDPRLLHEEDPALGRLNAAGVLTAADVHVARTLGRLCGEADPQVLLAAALTVRATRMGSVCLDLRRAGAVAPHHPWPDPEAWRSALTSSRLVAEQVLRLEGELLYLDRYWQAEGAVVSDLHRRISLPAPEVDPARLEEALDLLFTDEAYAEQRAAAEASARRRTSVITGGPGTGKTSTLARLLAVLQHLADRPLRVALAAPTGKAAARMSQAIVRATDDRSFPPGLRGGVQGLTASTLHRLLGVRPDSGTRFRHHRGNHLVHDVVVVDETSMVSLTMMARLLEALRPDARLVLVGDADQLASVEAGAVLKDLVEGLPTGAGVVSHLHRVHRFGAGIGELAEAVRGGDGDRAWAVLRQQPEGVELVDPADHSRIRHVVEEPALALVRAAAAGDARATLAALEEHRLLCAHREGPSGVSHWNAEVERWLMDALGRDWLDTWYAGQPLLVNSNDYGLRLWNGDTGVVTATPTDGVPRALFDDGSPGGRSVPLSRLADVQTAHAMTVHRAQGSQFRDVTVVLPPDDSLLLTRELLYTALTRAERTVRVVADRGAVTAAVEREARRATGLGQRLGRAP
ncbi:MAG TPA: exodeoxyribonuclease V subunit alpha [Nocardioides sp.]|nr:exodeoxyribonuclease V subunit alpha [Nocardioides sp.]